MSESDNYPLNSSVNPRNNPSLFVPPDQAKLDPNVSVSGFIYETPYRGPGTRLQAQREGIEARIEGVITRFDEFKLGIADWENFIKSQSVFLC